MTRLAVLLATLSVALAPDATAQGCVAIRHFSSAGGDPHGAALGAGDLALGTSYRYFESFRHFRGRHEEPDRVASGTEVVNHAHALDLNVAYGLTGRTFLRATLPFVVNDRSSLYEHGRTERASTHSRGLGDVVVGVGAWVLDPAAHPRANVAVGLGLKLPTGSYHTTDLFYNVGPEGHPEVRPVDQSIQPGDGGLGVALDTQGYVSLGGRASAYAAGYYLANPRETNGVRTFRETLSALLANEAVMSVPDQFSVRAGAAYAFPAAGVTASVGARYEGVPVRDLVGGDGGFRRPGTVLSVEPGVSYGRGGLSVSLSVPVALVRNRPQSVTDLETEAATGTERHGDAAFADYLVNVGVGYRLPLRRSARAPGPPDIYDLAP